MRIFSIELSISIQHPAKSVSNDANETQRFPAGGKCCLYWWDLLVGWEPGDFGFLGFCFIPPTPSPATIESTLWLAASAPNSGLHLKETPHQSSLPSQSG
jgi:hypothetical protein